MNLRVFRWVYSVLAAVVLLFAAWSVWQGRLPQTDFAALLPQEHAQPLFQAADAANEERMNGQVLLLAGSADSGQAFQTAAEIADLWRGSGLFAEVDSGITPDLEQIRRDVRRLGLATLPENERRWLAEQPQEYFRRLAEQTANPFAAASPLPLDEDWLGFGRFVLERAKPDSRLQWNADNGMLYTEDGGTTWVWLRGRLRQNGLTAADTMLPELMEHSRRIAAKQNVRIQSTGGALFSAAAKTAAERESRLMSAAGIGLTLALLLWAFRNVRVLALVLPLLSGSLFGYAAVVLGFGEIHVLTAVIGTSLIGMLVDYPLHWLTPSLFGTANGSRWQAQNAMRQMLPNFAVSLGITVLGYAMLWFAPLPILRQTAVFSIFALLGALGATVAWLPLCFRNGLPPNHRFAALMTRALAAARRVWRSRVYQAALAVLVLTLVFGLVRSNWRDDLRQWAAMPPDLLAQAQDIARLSGQDLGGAYVLVSATNPDALLEKSAAVRKHLQPLVADGHLGSVRSLDEWVMTQAAQQALQQRLRAWSVHTEYFAPMHAIGVPDEAVQAALRQWADEKPLTLSESLQPSLAEAWRSLYLGKIADGQYGAVVRLGGIRDSGAVAAAVDGIEGAYWVDKRAHLNAAFGHIRNLAGILKLASLAVAALVLWKIFGVARGSTIVLVPLGAAAATLAVFGWLGIPVSLFAMFGLLLVSAVGVDYAVYAVAARETPAARLGGMVLAAATTGISFGLLGLSGTPAIAAFGGCVAVGVLFNLWFAVGLLSVQAENGT